MHPAEEMLSHEIIEEMSHNQLLRQIQLVLLCKLF